MSTIFDTTDGEQTICSCSNLNTNFTDTKPICAMWQGDAPGDRCRACGHWEVCHNSPRLKVNLSHERKDKP